MLRLLRKSLIAILGAGLLLAWAGGGLPALAQSALTVEALTIEVWPEFDKPAGLVLITGSLVAGTAVPTQVTVRIPAAAGGPHATAYTDSNGQMLTAPATTRTEGTDLLVTMTVEAPNFHVEYYDPGLVINGQSRSFSFRWVTDYAVKSTVVRVQEPAGASDLRLNPAFTPDGTGQYGLSYLSRDWGPVGAGATVAFTLDYTKSSPALSAESVSVNPPTERVAVDNGPAAASPLGNLPPWAIGAVVVGAVGVVGGGAWLAWRRWQPGTTQRLKRSRRRPGPTQSGPRRAGSDEAPGPAVIPAKRFCTQCGQPLAAGDRFCRNCGAQIND